MKFNIVNIDTEKWRGEKHHLHYITSDNTCSRCRRKIPDDDIPLRFWPKSDPRYMLIYCDDCIDHVICPIEED
jgi:NAD-dependent SIR2 family protein deacetylase